LYEKPTVETPAPAKPAPVRPTSPLHDNDGKDEGGDDKQEDLYSFGASFPPHHLDIEDAPAGAVVGTAVSGPSILFRLGPDAAAAAVAVEDPSAEIAEVVAEAGRAGGVEAKGGADGDSQQGSEVPKESSSAPTVVYWTNGAGGDQPRRRTTTTEVPLPRSLKIELLTPARMHARAIAVRLARWTFSLTLPNSPSFDPLLLFFFFPRSSSTAKR
jgi:hypothetical protein